MSKKDSLSFQDIKNQCKTALEWLIPLFGAYVLQLQGTLSAKGVILLSDLKPTLLTVGAMELYVLNQMYGLVKRYKAGE